METKDKMADNQIYINKLLIDNLESQIDTNKEKLKTLNTLEDGFISLSKSIEKCVELLGASMKGNAIERKLADISDNNKIYLRSAMGNIDDQRISTNNELKNLYNKKDEAETERKRLFREQEEKEHIYKDEIPEVERNKEVERIEEKVENKEEVQEEEKPVE